MEQGQERRWEWDGRWFFKYLIEFYEDLEGKVVFIFVWGSFWESGNWFILFFWIFDGGLWVICLYLNLEFVFIFVVSSFVQIWVIFGVGVRVFVQVRGRNFGFLFRYCSGKGFFKEKFWFLKEKGNRRMDRDGLDRELVEIQWLLVVFGRNDL